MLEHMSLDSQSYQEILCRQSLNANIKVEKSASDTKERFKFRNQ